MCINIHRTRGKAIIGMALRAINIFLELHTCWESFSLPIHSSYPIHMEYTM